MNKRQSVILIVMALGVFLCMLDTTIMNIALPAIKTGLHTNLEKLQWTLNVYTIIFASLTIPLGRLGDQLGKHKVYILGLLFFGIGSLMSATSTSIGMLIFSRGIQSIGAAIVFPTSMTIGINAVDISKRNSAVLILGITQGLAAALGPTIGGVITEYWGWRGIFLINIPVILLVVGLCIILLPIKNERCIKSNLDVLGTLLSISTLFSLTLVIIKGNDWNWNSTRIISLLVLFSISLGLFIWQEWQVDKPMIRLDLFKYRNFTGATLVTIGAGIFFVGIIVLMPSFFTKIQGYSELQAALMITPASIMVFICSPISGLLLKELGSRLLIGLGIILMGSGYQVISIMNSGVYWKFLAAFILIGAGYGLVIGPITVLSAGNFTGELLTASQSVIGVFRQIGTVLAVAIFVSALNTNVNSAKYEIWSVSKNNVSRMNIDKYERRDILKQTHHNLFAVENSNTNVKLVVDNKTKNKIIDKQFKNYLKQNHLKNASFNIKKRIRKGVIKKVDVKFSHLNGAIENYLIKTKALTNTKMTQAFINPYKVALPYVWLLLGLVFWFEKKNKDGTRLLK